MGRGSGLLHYQAERVEGQGGAIPLPGQCLEGLTIRKSQGVGEGTPPPKSYCGAWWEGTAIRSRDAGGGGYRLQILRRGGRGGGEASIAFCSQFCGRRGGGGLGLDTPCPPRYPLGDGCW